MNPLTLPRLPEGFAWAIGGRSAGRVETLILVEDGTRHAGWVGLDEDCDEVVAQLAAYAEKRWARRASRSAT